MASQSSFDIVSDYDKAEIINVYDQVGREIDNRYDFKGTPASVTWSSPNKDGLLISGDSDMQIDTILDIVRKKLAARGQSQKIIDTSKPSATSNFKTTKLVPFIRGLDQDKAKKVTSLIRDNYPKVKTQIQGDSVRATSSSKDELQAVIQLLNQQDWDFAVQFINYR